MEIKELIKAIDETAQSIDLYINFNSPVSEEEINDLEKAIEEKLPIEIRKFYLTANGQESNSDYYTNIKNQENISQNKKEPIDLFFWEHLADPDIGYQWLTLKTTLIVWEENNKILLKSSENAVGIKGEVKQYWWHKKWLPIALDIEGNSYCIDLDPGEAGKKYQIIQWLHDSEDRYVVAKSMTELFKERLDILKNITTKKTTKNS